MYDESKAKMVRLRNRAKRGRAALLLQREPGDFMPREGRPLLSPPFSHLPFRNIFRSMSVDVAIQGRGGNGIKGERESIPRCEKKRAKKERERVSERREKNP